MNKTITITLNGIVFYIEEDAYEILREYLDSVGNYFSSSPDKREILADIENGLAEKFSEKIRESKQVISERDIRELIEIMGTVADFSKEMPVEKNIEKEEGERAKIRKKFYRDTSDVMIAGVCSGLATYFNLDVSIIRLLFVISIFFGGAGIFLYLILWISALPAKTSYQKLEMHGEPVTLVNVEQVVKEEKVKKNEDNDDLSKKIISRPAEALSGIIKLFVKIFKIFFVIVGVFMIISSFIAIFILTFVMANFLFNIDSPYIFSDVPLEEIAKSIPIGLGVSVAYLTMVIPLFFIFLIGLVLTGKKRAIGLPIAIILIGLWMFSAVAFSVLAVRTIPIIQEKASDQGFVKNIAREFNVDSFKSVVISGKYDVEIRKGEEFKMSAKGIEEGVEAMKVDVSGGELMIGENDHLGFCLFCFEKPSVDIVIEMPELNSFSGDKNSMVIISGFKGDDLELSLNGISTVKMEAFFSRLNIKEDGFSSLELTGTSSEIIADLNGLSKLLVKDMSFLNEMNVYLDGTSYALLKGDCEKMRVELNGASRLEAFDFKVEEIFIDVEGVSRANVNAVNYLEAEANGAGRVYYQGGPNVEENKSENGQIIKVYN